MGWEEGGTNVVVGWVEGTGGSNSALGLPAKLPAPLWHWKEGNPPRFLDGVSGKHVVGCRLGLEAWFLWGVVEEGRPLEQLA